MRTQLNQPLTHPNPLNSLTHQAVKKKEVEDAQAALRRAEQAIDDTRDAQNIEITTQKQKLKHLLLELHSGVTDTHIEGETVHKQQQVNPTPTRTLTPNPNPKPRPTPPNPTL